MFQTTDRFIMVGLLYRHGEPLLASNQGFSNGNHGERHGICDEFMVHDAQGADEDGVGSNLKRALNIYVK